MNAPAINSTRYTRPAVRCMRPLIPKNSEQDRARESIWVRVRSLQSINSSLRSILYIQYDFQALYDKKRATGIRRYICCLLLVAHIDAIYCSLCLTSLLFSFVLHLASFFVPTWKIPGTAAVRGIYGRNTQHTRSCCRPTLHTRSHQGTRKQQQFG